MTLASVGARLVMMLGQWGLAFFLSPAQTGVLGLAGTISSVVWTVVDFGLDEVLQQRGRSIQLWERAVFGAVLLQSLIGMLLLAASGPLFGDWLDAPELPLAIAVISVGMPLAALSTVSKVKLNARLEFKWLAGFGVVELLAVQIFTFAFLFAGWGLIGVVAAGPLGLGLRALCYLAHAPPRRTGRWQLRRVSHLLRRGASVFGRRLLLAAVNSGDYLVLGFLTSTAAVGYYFFAFRLAALPVRVLAENLQQVLFPALARFSTQEGRRLGASVRAASALAHILTPLCLAQVVLAPPLLQLIFAEEWAPAIPLVQLLSLGLPLEGLAAVARAQLSADGEFARSFRFMLINCVLFLFAAVLGAKLGGAVGLAASVAIYYAITQPYFFFSVIRPDQSSRGFAMFLQIFFVPYAIAAVSLGSSALLAGWLWRSDQLLAQAITLLLVAPLLHVPLARLFAPAAFADILQVASRFLKRG